MLAMVVCFVHQKPISRVKLGVSKKIKKLIKPRKPEKK
jgi:hypothetical protein